MQTQKVEVNTLKPHPRQQQVFGAPNDDEVDRLAQDIEQNGQRHPIVTLANGTIVCGHTRVQAAKKLGMTQIEAIVREDLGDAPNAPEVIELLIKDNLVRRQLDDLGKARAYKALKQSENKKHHNRRKNRDDLAAIVAPGKSGRTMERLLRLVERLPIDLQNMISQGQLTKLDGQKIADFRSDEFDSAVKAIRDSEDLRNTLIELGIRKAPKQLPTAIEKFKKILLSLHRNQEQFESCVNELATIGVRGANTTELLANAANLFDLVHNVAHANYQENLQRIRDRLALLDPINSGHFDQNGK